MHPNITSWVCVIQKRFSKSGTPEKKFNPHFTIILYPPNIKRSLRLLYFFSKLWVISNFHDFCLFKKKRNTSIYPIKWKIEIARNRDLFRRCFLSECGDDSVVMSGGNWEKKIDLTGDKPTKKNIPYKYFNNECVLILVLTQLILLFKKSSDALRFWWLLLLLLPMYYYYYVCVKLWDN